MPTILSTAPKSRSSSPLTNHINSLFDSDQSGRFMGGTLWSSVYIKLSPQRVSAHTRWKKEESAPLGVTARKVQKCVIENS